MEGNTATETAAEPALFRFWSLPDWSAIRIVFAGGSYVCVDGARLQELPECIRLAVRDCLADRQEHGVPGCSYEGVETAEQMDIDCEECLVVGAPCTACFVEHMARLDGYEADSAQTLGLGGLVAL